MIQFYKSGCTDSTWQSGRGRVAHCLFPRLWLLSFHMFLFEQFVHSNFTNLHHIWYFKQKWSTGCRDHIKWYPEIVHTNWMMTTSKISHSQKRFDDLKWKLKNSTIQTSLRLVPNIDTNVIPQLFVLSDRTQLAFEFRLLWPLFLHNNGRWFYAEMWFTKMNFSQVEFGAFYSSWQSGRRCLVNPDPYVTMSYIFIWTNWHSMEW